MQLELAPEIEERLVAEGHAIGLTAAELTAQIVEKYARSLKPIETQESREERHAFIEQHIAWLKANNPNPGAFDPYGVDWQAVKAEGRKY